MTEKSKETIRSLDKIPTKLKKHLEYILGFSHISINELSKIMKQNKIDVSFVEGFIDGQTIAKIEVEKAIKGTEIIFYLEKFEDAAYATEELVHLIHLIINPALRSMSIEAHELNKRETALRKSGANIYLAEIELGRLKEKEEAQANIFVQKSGINISKVNFSEINQHIEQTDNIQNLLHIFRSIFRYADKILIQKGEIVHLLNFLPYSIRMHIYELQQRIISDQQDPKDSDLEPLYNEIDTLINSLDQNDFSSIDINKLKKALSRISFACQADGVAQSRVEATVLSLFDDLPADPDLKNKFLENPQYIDMIRNLLLESDYSPLRQTSEEAKTNPGDFISNTDKIYSAQQTMKGEEALLEILKASLTQKDMFPEQG